MAWAPIILRFRTQLSRVGAAVAAFFVLYGLSYIVMTRFDESTLPWQQYSRPLLEPELPMLPDAGLRTLRLSLPRWIPTELFSAWRPLVWVEEIVRRRPIEFWPRCIY